MADKVIYGVVIGEDGRKFVKGDEDALAALNLPAERLQELEAQGAIAGFSGLAPKAAVDTRARHRAPEPDAALETAKAWPTQSPPAAELTHDEMFSKKGFADVPIVGTVPSGPGFDHGDGKQS